MLFDKKFESRTQIYLKNLKVVPKYLNVLPPKSYLKNFESRTQKFESRTRKNLKVVPKIKAEVVPKVKAARLKQNLLDKKNIL